MVNHERGKCPRCKRFSLDYYESTLKDNQIGFECYCAHGDCPFMGREWHSLKFVCFTDEEGNEIG